MRRPGILLLVLGMTAAACSHPAPGPASQAAPDAAASEPGAGAPAEAPGGAVPAATVKFVYLDGLRAELATRKRAGRPVFLNLWATWCAPCVDELPALGNLARELGAKDPEIIGVSLDALTVPERDRVEPKIRDALSQSRVSYANLVVMGDQQAFMKEYGVSSGIPLSILYDGGGKTVQRWLG